MTLGHRVAVLRDARLQQFDTPRTLYARPANMFVAEFIGSPSMNLCRLPVEHGALAFGGVDIAVPETVRNGHSELIVGLRPESLSLAADGCDATVEVVEEIGADTHVFCAAQIAGHDTKLVARVPTNVAPSQGERVHLRPTGGDVHFFDPESGARLPA